MGERETQARQRAKIERKVFIIDPERVQRDHPKCEADAGDVDGSSYAICKKRVTVTSSSQVTRAALYKEWRKLETISADQLNKVKSRNEVNKEAQKDKRKVHPATLMDIRRCEKYKDNMENAQTRRGSVSTRSGNRCETQTIIQKHSQVRNFNCASPEILYVATIFQSLVRTTTSQPRMFFSVNRSRGEKHGEKLWKSVDFCHFRTHEVVILVRATEGVDTTPHRAHKFLTPLTSQFQECQVAHALCDVVGSSARFFLCHDCRCVFLRKSARRLMSLLGDFHATTFC